MKKLWFLQIDISGYTYSVVSETEKGCHTELERVYNRIRPTFLDEHRNYYQFLDFIGIEKPQQIELNKAF